VPERSSRRAARGSERRLRLGVNHREGTKGTELLKEWEGVARKGGWGKSFSQGRKGEEGWRGIPPAGLEGLIHGAGLKPRAG
jgi:hypothetical protein